MLVVSFAEAQGREEGLAGSLASLRHRQDIGLPQVEGEIQFERSHLGEKGIPCGKVSKQDPGDVRKRRQESQGGEYHFQNAGHEMVKGTGGPGSL